MEWDLPQQGYGTTVTILWVYHFLANQVGSVVAIMCIGSGDLEEEFQCRPISAAACDCPRVNW